MRYILLTIHGVHFGFQVLLLQYLCHQQSQMRCVLVFVLEIENRLTLTVKHGLLFDKRRQRLFKRIAIFFLLDIILSVHVIQHFIAQIFQQQMNSNAHILNVGRSNRAQQLHIAVNLRPQEFHYLFVFLMDQTLQSLRRRVVRRVMQQHRQMQKQSHDSNHIRLAFTERLDIFLLVVCAAQHVSFWRFGFVVIDRLHILHWIMRFTAYHLTAMTLGFLSGSTAFANQVWMSFGTQPNSRLLVLDGIVNQCQHIWWHRDQESIQKLTGIQI
mmetsp:Transcript_31043/g.49859  ORF Transcript_31043/g.49859 Transcript_31043/m.49859 type:complete len:270 (-) Transcript_31043:38-847(-)